MGRPRILLTLAAMALCVLPAGLLPASGNADPARTELRGSFFSGTPPAPDFGLTDQQGRPFRLSDAKGKPVLLTFIYTHCTDTCPFISIKIRQACKLLGSQAKNFGSRGRDHRPPARHLAGCRGIQPRGRVV